jgi:hypothetical protein
MVPVMGVTTAIHCPRRQGSLKGLCGVTGRLGDCAGSIYLLGAPVARHLGDCALTGANSGSGVIAPGRLFKSLAKNTDEVPGQSQGRPQSTQGRGSLLRPIFHAQTATSKTTSVLHRAVQGIEAAAGTSEKS